MATSVFVSGRMRVLFELQVIPIDSEGVEVSVNSYVCKWCGWRAVVDDPALLPDHECSGPSRTLDER